MSHEALGTDKPLVRDWPVFVNPSLSPSRFDSSSSFPVLPVCPPVCPQCLPPRLAFFTFDSINNNQAKLSIGSLITGF